LEKYKIDWVIWPREDVSENTKVGLVSNWLRKLIDDDKVRGQGLWKMISNQGWRKVYEDEVTQIWEKYY
jgi:hypothetical protein